MSETSFGNEDSDTHDLSFRRGDHVRVAVADLGGAEGTVVAFRADARLLIRLRQGVYLEVSRFCVTRLT
jgi:hypothetical protein